MQEIGTGLATLEVDGHRADVRLSRPEKRNAMTVPLMRDLGTALERADAHEDVRAITLLGEGEVFSAGMDLRMMRERVDREARSASERASDEAASEASDATRDAFPELLDTLESTDAPTVAGIKRAGPAGAFELTLPCDFRVLGADADYGVVEVRLGTFPHGGATQRLPRLVGLAKAKELVLTGEYIDPADAEAFGLVNEVVPDDEVDAASQALADRLAENAPLGMANAKRALNAALDTPLDEGLELEQALGRELDDTRDYREGFEARIEGREPEFEGR
ncbi:enoyl-CoA hydratase/isomerase family protein [Halorarius halobius]|uniref:enoyl-CoA hydratase/isomerase family protein n=1 Tax=Halorarius halobius TaxID=2962671 RepID=UPI0020CC83B4|nr:enoyl-CoA hydratase/isomerase family protein [Halorarius halobius]